MTLRPAHSTRGQSLAESVLVMPLFFFLVFGLLQIAQLGIALVVTQYAASSLARKAANESGFPPVRFAWMDVTGIVQSRGTYVQKVANLMTV